MTMDGQLVIQSDKKQIRISDKRQSQTFFSQSSTIINRLFIFKTLSERLQA